ncbi:MAG: SBBP repeat-containing protein, partial [Micromonosporaceae bacterium]
QTDAGVDFVARGGGYSLFTTPTRMVASLTKRTDAAANATDSDEARSAVVRMDLVGSDPGAKANGGDRLAGTVNHLVGDRSQWRTGIPIFGQVSYSGVYPGVDLKYYGDQDGLEYDFVVEPGADPSVITLSFPGVQALSLADNGDLVLSTEAGEVRQTKPTLYQELGGRRQEVPGRFVLRPGNQVGFEVGTYDTARTLVIDPVLDYSTFLGGSANDFGWGIAVDRSGRTWVGGETSSAVFPGGNDAPPGATKPATGTDGFVLRMDAEGDALDFVTFIGGTGADSGQDLAVDGSGNAYLTGSTASSNFPTSPGAYDATCGTDACDGTADHFLTKLSSSGAITYSTYLGGSGVEQHAPGTPYSGSAGIAVKGSMAYLHSNTFSEDFPLTDKAFQTSCGSCADGSSDGYLAVIDTSKSGAAGLVYSTYVGGDGDEQSKAVALDGDGKAYLTGITVALAADPDTGELTGTNSFPVKSAYQPTYRGGYSDAYLTKIDPFAKSAEKTLKYSTFLGGGGLEEGWGVAVRNDQAYVTGYTTSGPDPFAAFANPLDPATDPVPYFPTTVGAYDTSYGGRASTDSGSTLFLDGDAFVFVMNDDGDGPVWSTFVGGPAADYGQGIAIDSAGQVYITGWTTCRMQDNRATAGVNEAPPQFEPFDDDDDPSTDPIQFPTGRGPGDPDATGVGDCDGANPYGTDTVPAGTFPQVNPIVDPGRGLDESAMDSTYLGFELHNSPTGVFVTNLTADGTAADYSLVLDGPGFDRGFAIAVRDRSSGNRPITPEAYVTGRTGRQGYPVVGSTAPGATLYDGTYNGAGRDTFISKLVG